MLEKNRVLDLLRCLHVAVGWIPLFLSIKGKDERGLCPQGRTGHLDLDARRWTSRRGAFPIRGPLTMYDWLPSLVGGAA